MSEVNLDAFAFSAEELIKDVDSISDLDYMRMRRYVCLCGHSYYSHRMRGKPEKSCQIGQRPCHCPKFNPVLETDNLRVFKRVSRGQGTLHALSQGIRALMEKGGSYTILEKALVCYKCKTEGAKVLPALVTTDGYSVNFKEEQIIVVNRVDIFLCQDCYDLLESTGSLKG